MCILKVILCAVFILPFRALGVLIFACLLFSVCALMIAGLSDKDLRERPLSGWRRVLRQLAAFLARCVVFCCGFHYIKINGRREPRSKAPILVAAPHSSFLDSFVFPTLGFPTTVCRYENVTFPVLGRVLKAVQPILVKRENLYDKLDAVTQIATRTDLAQDWPQILIFPEGTTTNRTCLITFKPGAFTPAVPVQPVIFKYNNRFNTTIWTIHGLSGLQVIFYTLCQFNNKIEISVYYFQWPLYFFFLLSFLISLLSLGLSQVFAHLSSQSR
jgi:lysophosphatidylcholine acyltransferase/lyso-PAF acetyltransferase